AMLTFAAERADLSLQLARSLWPALGRDQLEQVYLELELPLAPVLVAIERAGVRIDGAALASQSQRIDRELATRSAQIFDLAGEAFNINSPQQLSKIFLERFQLRAARR